MLSCLRVQEGLPMGPLPCAQSVDVQLGSLAAPALYAPWKL